MKLSMTIIWPHLTSSWPITYYIFSYIFLLPKSSSEFENNEFGPFENYFTRDLRQMRGYEEPL